MGISHTELDQLNIYVDRSGGPEACWPWIKKRRSKGYGTLSVDGRSKGAHVAALELSTTEQAAGRMALHSCDNPPCCNPAHLRWGNASDNISDAVDRGRRAMASGSRSCPECGNPVVGVRQLATFCCAPCRHSFNNRRAARGAALYDLWMAHRYQRGLAKLVGCFDLMCALGQEYREEDVQRRGHGWYSWLDPKEAVAKRPWLNAKVLRGKGPARQKGS